MTRFLDVPATYRLVADIGVPRFLDQLAQTIRDDYLRWSDFDKSPRVACHSQFGVIELMPVADAKLFAFKYVNGHPINAGRGMHTVMAFGALASVDTGYPLLLSELTLTTALRTAATSVLAAKALARPDSRSMALIGNGAQSEFQAIAFHTLLGIDEIRLFDVDSRATDKLIRNLAAWPQLRIVRATSTAQAVRGADIVTTVTADKAYATIITPDMIEPGMHLNAVGGDCPGKTELHADVLNMSRVIVEYEPQTRIEGEIQQLPADSAVIELWRVLSGEIAGRESAQQVTVFDSVGFALEDYSALRYLHALAQEHNVGIDVALIPATSDPKDLFGELATAASGAAQADTALASA
ncbi:ornithine cyclodeaminase [Paraburkholderia antibiotica]|uniref:Ornithine cyclodeaminase n=1 Tax=Paraburkholderia antibiotica TaxID=2728839 RepID=A0A7Y0FFU7_9BURK|nr:ornithine cyclodeaminase [Paraburkholderia antibiotica]NML34444.1 ornithine cyclodeaminase [Paraburkholderia antibiotica]